MPPAGSGGGGGPGIPDEGSSLEVIRGPRLMRLRIRRPERGNAIDAGLIRGLGAALDAAEADAECRTVTIEGGDGVFCTGMDFRAAMEEPAAGTAEAAGIAEYMRLLTRFTRTPKVVVALVDGKAIAGGVGLVAAADHALATPRSEFSLSEALWGLLPCCVLPFLMRRVGFQRAYTMTLGTRSVGAAAAVEMRLVDEVTDDLEGALRRLVLRWNLLDTRTVSDLKAYFRRLMPISPEIESLAVREITRLSNQPWVRGNIAAFVEHGRYPWESGGGTGRP